MHDVEAALDLQDWRGIGAQLDTEGYAVLPGLWRADVARRLAQQTTTSGTHRVALASCGMGRGALFYFGADLPAPLAPWRMALYRRLVPIANRWNASLGETLRYPVTLGDFLQRNRQAGQTRPPSHLSRLGVDDHVVLHRRADGEQVFPLQIVALLSQPGVDFQGGEFVMTEQRPRMQSRPMVVPLQLGDAAVIATADRPFKGRTGTYRVKLKHAISRVHAGERIGLELSFHNDP